MKTRNCFNLHAPENTLAHILFVVLDKAETPVCGVNNPVRLLYYIPKTLITTPILYLLALTATRTRYFHIEHPCLT